MYTCCKLNTFLVYKYIWFYYLNIMSINLLKFMQYAQLLNANEYDYVEGFVVGEEETHVSIIIFDNVLLVLVYFFPKCTYTYTYIHTYIHI